MTQASVSVRMNGISKRFPGVTALDSVDFDFEGGAVTGVAGENGSGKSTLMKVLAGRYRADSGEVFIDGERVSLDSPHAAMAAGIAMVAQEILVHAHLSVAENLACGDLPRTRLGFVDHRRLRRQALDLLERYDLDIDPDATLGQLPLRSRQVVSILKMASRRPRVLILDEPTSSLGEAEIASLTRLVTELRDQGTAVVYITHRLREYFDLCDAVMVLRDGVVTARRSIYDLDEERLIELMVGREVDLSPRAAEQIRPAAAPRLELRGVSVGSKLTDISMTVRDGEVVGVAGQAGAGRSTLAKTLFGLVDYSGEISLGGEPVTLDGARSAISNGIALVPEDRKEAGLVLTMSVIDNLTMPRWRQLSRGGVLPERAKDDIAKDAIGSMRIRTPASSTLVRDLSGGNQQKIVIGKWTSTQPSLLVLDEPTRGIDVGAKHEIYNLIDRFTSAGLAVLVFSSELQELLHVCDRIVVLYRGRIAGELVAGQATEEAITRLAFGQSIEGAA